MFRMTGIALALTATIACAPNAYDESGAVIAPPTARAAQVPTPALIDRELRNLATSLDETQALKTVAAFTAAAIIACQIRDCPKGFEAQVMLNGTQSSLQNTSPVNPDIANSRGQALRGFEYAQKQTVQMEQLASVAQAMAFIARRDADALTGTQPPATTAQRAAWADLYADREARLFTLVPVVARKADNMRRTAQGVAARIPDPQLAINYRNLAQRQTAAARDTLRYASGVRAATKRLRSETTQ
ncbi:hypothetical protein [Yoonia sp. SS1-5]|uniref:DUF4142 domain-containing protein n=1 Tax=Yoonia rhodophyticola TaxID=3137370 RepID=A0AAN0NJW7_9RHOB